MDLTGGGTAIMLAIAAGLWFLYLVPTWVRRREYLAWTERVVEGCRGLNCILDDLYDAMLKEGRKVTETCFACGYNNLSHFSRSFGRRFGVSPSRLAR